jgi:DNA polymerase III alpha subunit
VALSTFSPVFVPLHVKSRYSIGIGTGSIPALVQHAGRSGCEQLGLTDVENVYGHVQFHAACRAAGLKPISGVELRTGFHPHRSLGARAGRLVLLAADARGYAALCRIVTQRRNQPHSGAAPLQTIETLGSLGSDGAFWLSDDPLLLARLVRVWGPTAVRALLVRPQPTTPEPELVATAQRLGVALVADVDATLLDANDAALQRLACAAHLGRDIEAARATLGADAARPLPTCDAIEALFADRPDAVRESRAVAEACTLDLLALPNLRDVAGERQRELDHRCRARLAARLPPGSDARYVERLDSELRAIERLGLTDLYASVAALIEAAAARNIPLAARGSAVSSLAGHLLGFSPIDPLAHGLYFERFASAARRSPPDIDLDVASRRRDELIEGLIAARGATHTARLCALAAYRRRSAHRAGLRALGAPRDAIERWLTRFPPDELADAVPGPSPSRLPEPWRRSAELIEGLVGLPRHLAIHPGGVVLADRPLAERVPLERVRSGASVTQYDATSWSRLGCINVDLLGSHVLDELSDTLAEVRRRSDVPAWAHTTSAIPLDDAATLAAIDRADTIGCFQLESPAQRAVLARLPVRRLDDVAHALAIVRPGPASGDAKELFIARARGELDSPELDPLLAERLRGTHGVLLYEEDILFVLSQLAGLPLDAAEAARASLLAHADDEAWLERARRRFLQRTGARGIAPSRAERAWGDVLRFLRYSFNQAHTASQALLGYQAAFLKVHATLELGRALLDHHGGLYPRRVIAAELARRGVLLLPPSVVRSEPGCSIERSNDVSALRVGLGLIARLRAATRQRILAARHRQVLASAADLLEQVHPDPRELRALVESGAGDELLGIAASDPPSVHERVLERLLRGDVAGLSEAIVRAREGGPQGPPELVERYRRLRRVQRELEHLGMHISDHPARILRAEARRQGCIESHRLREHAGERVAFAGIIAATRRVPLASAGVTQFITLEDEHGLVEARLSPAAYERLHLGITTPGPYLIAARVCEQQGAVHLAVESLMPFHLRPNPL